MDNVIQQIKISFFNKLINKNTLLENDMFINQFI